MESIGSTNSAWAASLVDGLVAAGVARAVISPGSRSTPLAVACLRHPDLSSRILLDERTAAFFALGLAKAEGRPVILVCTSGSAVANWHPAVAEADAARLPLILLSADRPPELQDCGANQTIDQARLFGHQLRAFHALPPAESDSRWLASFTARVVSQSLWPLPGPVQVNVPFREPLLGPLPAVAEDRRPVPQVLLPRLMPAPDDLAALAAQLSGQRGVIVAGAEPLPAAAIARLAATLDWPIVADPLSGLRFGRHDRSHVLAGADTFLRGSGLAADWVLRFGAFPVSKPVATWLTATRPRQIVVSADSRWPDPQRAAETIIHADPGPFAEALAEACGKSAPEGWLASFARQDAEAHRLTALHAPPEAVALRQIIATLPEGSLLFTGNSMAVRDLDSFSGTGDKDITVLCNRGTSGIDGNLASFFGAAASGRFTAAVAVVGDLTFLHDLGGLAAGQGVNASICLLDNDGGAIFEYLPQTALTEFEQGWLTPQQADFAAATAVWGHRYCRAEADCLAEPLAGALAAAGVSVLHVAVDRALSTARHRDLWAAARSSKEICA